MWISQGEFWDFGQYIYGFEHNRQNEPGGSVGHAHLFPSIHMTTQPHSPPDPAGPQEHTSLSQLFEALSRPPRRRVLTALARENPNDGAEFAPVDFTSSQRRDEVLTGLHHLHLPKLDAAGFIEWDADSETITHGPRFDEIEPLVELLVANRDELPAE